MSERLKDKLIPADEAADRLGLAKKVKDPERTIINMGKRGEIETRRVGKFVMVVEKSVDRIISGAA